MTWAESRPVVRAWVRDHFPELKGKMPDFLLARLAGVVESICEKEERASSATLFGKVMKGAEGEDRTLKQALEIADGCIDLRGREGANLQKKLGGGANGKKKGK